MEHDQYPCFWPPPEISPSTASHRTCQVHPQQTTSRHHSPPSSPHQRPSHCTLPMLRTTSRRPTPLTTLPAQPLTSGGHQDPDNFSHQTGRTASLRDLHCHLPGIPSDAPDLNSKRSARTFPCEISRGYLRRDPRTNNHWLASSSSRFSLLIMATPGLFQPTRRCETRHEKRPPPNPPDSQGHT